MVDKVIVHEPKLFQLKLYISGMSFSSVKAIENLKTICDNYLQNNFELEIIDIYQNPNQASEDDIIACPTLIKESPLPLKKIIGDLSNTSKVLAALGI